MDEYEIARRARTLPERFAARVTAETLESLQLMEAGGEHGLLTEELAAALAAQRTPVSAEEKQELRELLVAMDLPTTDADRLEVRG